MIGFSERRARTLFSRGMEAAEAGNFPTALNEFKAAAFVHKTPESLTHWGWMEHHLGDTEKAIELCQEAIEIDPGSGNPYNDIGTYMVALGRRSDAIPWFEKAIAACREIPPQFPHINLGRVYLSLRQYQNALHHFEEAHRHAPEDPEIEEIIRSLTRVVE